MNYTTVKQAEQLLKGMTSVNILGKYAEFKGVFPDDATAKEILDNIKVVISDSEVAKNALITELNNIITKTYVADNGKFITTMSNFYKDATSETGGYIREVSFDLPEVEKFDFTSADNENVFKKKVPHAHQVIHAINEQIRLTLTISDEELIKVVSSVQEFSAWINGLKEDLQLKASMVEEEYLRKVIQVVYDHEGVTKVSINNTLSPADKALTMLKTLENESFYMSRPNQYSLAGVTKVSAKENQVIIIRKDALTDIRMDSLATAFNMNMRDIENRILVIDHFGEGYEDIQCVLLDINAIIYEGRVNKFKSIENPKGLYTNIFYHKHDIVSVSPYRPILVVDLATPVDPEPTDPEVTE